MGRILLGIAMGLVLAMPSAQAVRLPKPPTVVKWDDSTIAQLNAWLELMWQLTNGRVTFDVTTTNPNGNRVGTRGDTVFYLNGADWKECVNITATTPASPTGNTWRCSANAYTVP